ncbi:platelet endothelial aggregation receptor 1 isoform X2 [Micractinium conductrix]|uniref:Platelet endothelial aggregation receptor 1 isoform X2 n=1 Tax=Micractinium conductrix TaxID=554055 RepID=A0A2P6V800_9CHLO|nr:platelet endothelial aggregation receptor 1 isoform X2 [Micractinium conductrix]|eukprot:PSC70216.1 platelet endothelial aggregation receptor 1 isoform X2 [Micractinium conductrix]
MHHLAREPAAAKVFSGLNISANHRALLQTPSIHYGTCKRFHWCSQNQRCTLLSVKPGFALSEAFAPGNAPTLFPQDPLDVVVKGDVIGCYAGTINSTGGVYSGGEAKCPPSICPTGYKICAAKGICVIKASCCTNSNCKVAGQVCTHSRAAQASCSCKAGQQSCHGVDFQKPLGCVSVPSPGQCCLSSQCPAGQGCDYGNNGNAYFKDCQPCGKMRGAPPYCAITKSCARSTQAFGARCCVSQQCWDPEGRPGYCNTTSHTCTCPPGHQHCKGTCAKTAGATFMQACCRSGQCAAGYVCDPIDRMCICAPGSEWCGEQKRCIKNYSQGHGARCCGPINCHITMTCGAADTCVCSEDLSWHSVFKRQRVLRRCACAAGRLPAPWLRAPRPRTAYCQSEGCKPASELYAVGSRSPGWGCCRDQDCTTSKCRDNQCACPVGKKPCNGNCLAAADVDAPSASRAQGQTCCWNTQCKSGLVCDQSSNTCRTDGCPNGEVKCRAEPSCMPIAQLNENGTQPYGWNCCVDQECESGTCSATLGTCICPAGQTTCSSEFENCVPLAVVSAAAGSRQEGQSCCDAAQCYGPGRGMLCAMDGCIPGLACGAGTNYCEKVDGGRCVPEHTLPIGSPCCWTDNCAVSLACSSASGTCACSAGSSWNSRTDPPKCVPDGWAMPGEACSADVQCGVNNGHDPLMACNATTHVCDCPASTTCCPMLLVCQTSEETC